MQFVNALPYEEALDKIGRKSPIGSRLSSSEWSDVPVQLRERAFFSARVESVRFLQRGRDDIAAFLQSSRELLPNGATALKTGSRSAFVDQMQRFLAAEGIERGDGSVRDLTSERRLGLIFDTQTRQAQDFGYRKQGLDPDVLNEFPAQRFIRIQDVKEPRNFHTEFEDKVYLKTDPIWERINQDFGVPWGPWGWGCGHDVEDVDRDEAEALGLIEPGAVLAAPAETLNDELGASVAGLEPDLVDKLLNEFGDRVTKIGDRLNWNPEAIGREQVAALGALRLDPIADAIELKVYGVHRDAVRAGLAAIEKVHNTPGLPTVPLLPLKQNWYGHLQPVQTAAGIHTDHLAVRASGPWPALTTVHEAGHYLDLEILGAAGNLATLQAGSEMGGVLQALAGSERIRSLRARLPGTKGSVRRHLKYLVQPHEQWARAYAQFVAERAGSPRLRTELNRLIKAAPELAWTAEDFTPIAEAITALFKSKGWL